MIATIKDISGHEPGDDPVVFWRPWIGHWIGLSPADMGSVLLSSYVESWEWVTEQTSG